MEAIEETLTAAVSEERGEQSKKFDKQAGVSIQIEVLKEYAEILKRHPKIDGKRKGMRKELIKLALKFPGAVFPGSKYIKAGRTKEEVALGLLAFRLGVVMKEKQQKGYPTMSFYLSAAKILTAINGSEMASVKELLTQSGFSRATLGRITHGLIRIGFIKGYLSGSYHRYCILEEGRKFMEEQGS